MVSAMRAASIGIACDESLAMTSSLTRSTNRFWPWIPMPKASGAAPSTHVPLAAVAHRQARVIRRQIAGGPRARVAVALEALGHALLEHPQRPTRARSRSGDAHAAGAARRAKAVDRDVGAALGAGRLPDQLAHQVRIARARGALDDPAEQVAVGRDVVEAPAVRAIRLLSGSRKTSAGRRAPRRAERIPAGRLCGTRRSAPRSRGSPRPRRCRRACRAGGACVAPR